MAVTMREKDTERQGSGTTNRPASDGPRSSAPDNRSDRKQCPWCDSFNTRFIQRGFTGPTDEKDQYIICDDCNRLTYEILSRTNRDMRVSQFQVGSTVRDGLTQTKYVINRVLKVGLNEYLLYVKPITRREANKDEPGLRFR
jgi:hypothetical protein